MKVLLAADRSEAGTVSGVFNFGAGDILEIREKSTGRLEMIPFTRQYVPEVNVKENFIIVETVLLNFAEDGETDSDES